MATGTMGLRRWQPGGWSGFAAGAALGAVLVAAAWGSTAVAGSRTGELAATGTGDAVGAYLAVVAEHERLLGETLALELAAERERSRLSVVAPTGLAPVESYAAEHGRLVGATLGGEFTGGPSVEVTAAPVAPGESYVEEHGRLLEGTLGVAIPLDFTAGVTPEDGGGQARPAAGVQLDFTAGVTPEDGGGEARPSRNGETYADEHERLLRGSGAFFPEGE